MVSRSGQWRMGCLLAGVSSTWMSAGMRGLSGDKTKSSLRKEESDWMDLLNWRR